MDEANGCERPSTLSSEFGPQTTRLLTVTEIADWLRLTPKGIYALVEARRIPFVKISNRLRFSEAEIEGWLRDNRVPASSELTR
ncbi:MAG: helix-turn-helix domain-containing protein [Myxococcales bacterium]|nr:helix-turn-helix domain-containing protein [Myxococcales bacterium]